jgi:rubrerythrin
MKTTTVSLLRGLFGILIVSASTGARGFGCGDCEDYVVVVPRLPPGNPDGSPPPPFDPQMVSDAECDELCGSDNKGCVPMVLDGNTPAVECTVTPDCSAGRRPRGLRRPKVAAPSRTAAWLARAAHLEAASVHAFSSLAAELSRLGAPDTLTRRARTAASEEARHARVMGRLARRRGAPVPPVRLRPTRPRSAVAIAIENAVEGCVAETFAALLAHHQARAAQDPGVRRAMRRIADDETAHAALALDVDAWIACRLTPAERARVARAKQRAARRLVDSWRADPQVAGELGLPESLAGRALALALDTALGWSATGPSV